MIRTKYKVITDDLLKKISTGFFKKGDKFYSEAELKQIYNVSSTTAVKVMDNLVGMGKVERFQGKGTFVSKNNNNELLKVSDLPLRNELVKHVDVVSMKKESNKAIQKILNIKDAYFKLIRIYYIGDNIVSDVNFTYVPTNYINPSHLNNLDDFTSIYRLYYEDFGINAYKAPFTQDNFIRDLPKDFIIKYFQDDIDYCYYQERKTFLSDKETLEYIQDYKNPRLFAQRLKREIL